MELKDFGTITLIVNEFGGLKHGEVQIYTTGELVIQYKTVAQKLEPHDLNMLLLIKQHEYEEELAPLVEERDEAAGPSWRERNLKSYIGSLQTVSYLLERLITFQEEQEQKAEAE